MYDMLPYIMLGADACPSRATRPHSGRPMKRSTFALIALIVIAAAALLIAWRIFDSRRLFAPVPTSVASTPDPTPVLL